MKHFVVGVSQLNMNIFVYILLLFDLVKVFNCEFYLIKDDHVEYFDGNNTDAVKNKSLNTSVLRHGDILGKLYKIK